jgi:phage terminase large subunit
LTSPIAREVADRKKRPARARLTFAGDMLAELLAELELSTRVRFPSPRYRDDPVAFFREVLGVEPWSRQVEVLEAVRDYPRVAVSSGHKVSKSHTAAGVALWFYCSFDDARVVMTSTTSRQVDQILWRELRMMRARSGRCVACKTEDPDGFRIPRPCPHSTLIEGEQGELARTGLKSPDFREVTGFTAREAEAVAGISGSNLLYIPDEASGIEDAIFEAIEGNRAGGARVVMFSNPTKNEGEFYEAFHGKARFYKTIRISSEETPNVLEGRLVIPGLATREWIEEKKLEWGEDSAQYKIRVKGEHATHEDGKIFSVHAITQAEHRWADTAEAGRLFVGLDPAGPTGSGDPTVMAPRRGVKLLALREFRGLDENGILAQLLGLLKSYRLPRETPVVVYDREGEIGHKVHVLLKAYVEDKRNKGDFDLVAVRASDRAFRQAHIYDRVRDELTANLEGWIRDGGAILEDVKLSAEMHQMEWKPDHRGRLKVTPKVDIRKTLGRSPDRYDALALSVWEPLSMREGVPASVAQQAADMDAQQIPTLDPYAGADAWRRR